ncbi:pantoate--beta-alanine ligase [Colwelliaceae bacterium 6471]
MKIISDILPLRQQVKEWRQQGLTIAFVPTMGNLHAGHMALVTEAQKRADKVVVSIFVNPMQFGLSEDIDNYPKTLAEDKIKLSEANTSLLFMPTSEVIYPQGFKQNTYVEVPNISDIHCGKSRPGHFRGVATIVCKLFNLVQPDIACFGSKDYQQLQVIQTMVDDLSLPIEIVPVEIIRAESGLALSSRNGYLTAEETATAAVLYQSLEWLAEQVKSNKNFLELAQQATNKINQAGLNTDYLNICHARTLQPATADDKELVILGSAFCGKARLIDNIQVSL